jgi:hypothetical protein
MSSPHHAEATLAQRAHAVQDGTAQTIGNDCDTDIPAGMICGIE